MGFFVLGIMKYVGEVVEIVFFFLVLVVFNLNVFGYEGMVGKVVYLYVIDCNYKFCFDVCELIFLFLFEILKKNL